jgi:hypothetical protein
VDIEVVWSEEIVTVDKGQERGTGLAGSEVTSRRQTDAAGPDDVSTGGVSDASSAIRRTVVHDDHLSGGRRLGAKGVER